MKNENWVGGKVTMPNEPNGLLTSPREWVRSFIRHYKFGLTNNLQFSFFIFQFAISSRLLFALCSLLLPLCSSAPAQTVTDKMVTAKSKGDRKSTRLNSSHTVISYAVFC